MCVDLVERDANGAGHRVLPCALDLQRIEVSYEKTCVVLVQERRQHRTWLSGEKEERDALRCETALHHLQSPQHERILAGRCTKELRRQAEDHCKRGTVTQRQVLGVEERPVVADPLVPAHPVDHGAGSRIAGPEDANA